MIIMKIPRFVIAGTQSGVGKTTLSIGIMKALRKRGLNVQSYKVGPDYIDPAFHSFVTGNKSRNLDSWMLKENAIKDIFFKNSFDKDISIIEGVMGFYDGFGIEKDNGSTAHLSKILKCPVILIINGSGMSSSAAAQVLGYKLYDEKVNIKGVIVNNVSGWKHYELIKEAVEKFTGIKCVGYLKKNIDIKLESRHLGLIPSVEVENLKEKIDKLSSMVEETINIDEIIKISKGALALNHVYNYDSKNGFRDVNIGVALDKAFNFYYQDNLDLLEELGANLIYFSPLKDKKLPDNLHGLYLGGGFPEVFAKELEENKELRDEIKKVSNMGMPIYAECGGLMYLCKSITTLDGKKYEMVGIFDRNTKMTNRLQRFGYVNVNILKPCTISNTLTKVKAHEFHRSIIDESNNDDCVYRVDKVRENKIINSWKCGILKNNTLAAYAHIHFYSNKKLAEDFVENCRVFKKGSV
nr:cobyrinate a,c-diamide synthase [Caminicella sporogenes]